MDTPNTWQAMAFFHLTRDERRRSVRMAYDIMQRTGCSYLRAREQAVRSLYEGLTDAGLG